MTQVLVQSQLNSSPTTTTTNEEWEGVEAKFLGKINRQKIAELVLEAQVRGQSPAELVVTIDSALRTAEANRGKLTDPVGAAVHFLTQGKWPTSATIVDADEIERRQRELRAARERKLRASAIRRELKQQGRPLRELEQALAAEGLRIEDLD